MHSNLVFGQDERVAEFVHGLLGKPTPSFPMVAIGAEVAGELIAGAVFFNCHPGEDISIGVAASRPFLKREWISRVLAYPFEELELPRISSEVEADNVKALKFNKRIGLEVEGLKRGPKPKVCFGMTKETYYGRW